MGGKKSNAKIRRLMKRAEARGEIYEPSPLPGTDEQDSEKVTQNDALVKNDNDDARNKDKKSKNKNNKNNKDQTKLRAAKFLETELERIKNDTELKSKERRSAKRKAEAIATETCGVAALDLLEWYEEYKQENTESKNNKQGNQKKQNPYIVFVGQLSFDTTKEALFRHFEKELSSQHKITDQMLSIRLLTDPKTKKSRGMAFVQVSDPKLLYACLKLHHTYLEGRRINVERSAGGGSKGEARKTKIDRYRQQQTEHVHMVVDTMLEEFYQAGSIQKGELDDGVVALCKRHSAAVVQASLEEYVVKHGRDMDNPSAYLTFLLGKMAQEGIREKKDNDQDKEKSSGHCSSSNKKQKTKATQSPPSSSSSLANQGVDMSISNPYKGAAASSDDKMASIFPSSTRGRGRAIH